MPELPEVQTVVTTLRRRLLGLRLARVVHLRPDIVRPVAVDLRRELTARIVAEIDRRCKRVRISLGPPGDGPGCPDNGDSRPVLVVHLGMTGQLTVEPADAAIRPHTHLVIDLAHADGIAAGRQLRFRDPRRFGRLRFCAAGEDSCDGLGPEPLSIRPRQLVRRLATTGRAIKAALLDQALLAGLGNIYADECLFAAGIHPLVPARGLSVLQVRRLTRAIKLTLRRAIRHRGSSFRDYVDADGRRGGFQALHRVYGREGLPCRACGRPIERIIVGGRSTHFCPSCQRGWGASGQKRTPGSV